MSGAVQQVQRMDSAPRHNLKVWRIPQGSPRDVAYRMSVDASTVAAAIETALLGPVQHKDTVLVLLTDTVTNEEVLHTFAVKRQSRPLHVWEPKLGKTVAVYKLYANPQFSVGVSGFAPKTPWEWERGADVVGIDRGLIKGRAA